MVRYTHKVVMTLLDSIREGMTLAVACRKAGVSRSTFRSWLSDPDKVSFREGYELAKAESEEALVRLVGEHAQSNAQTARWLLERRFSHWRDPLDTKLKQAKIQKEMIEVELARERLESMRDTATVSLMDVLAKPKQIEVKEDGTRVNEEGDKGGGGKAAAEAQGLGLGQGVWNQREPDDDAPGEDG